MINILYYCSLCKSFKTNDSKRNNGYPQNLKGAREMPIFEHRQT